MEELKHYICAERSELFEPNVLICYVVELRGSKAEELQEEKIKEAVKQAWKANESCYERVVIREDGSAGYLPVLECHNSFFVENPNTDLFRVITREEKKTFHIDEGEMMRIFMSATGEKTCKLLIMAHHLAGDGKSILFFVQDILRFLSGVQVPYKEMVEVDTDNLPKESRLHWAVSHYCKTINKKWKKEEKIFHFRDYYEIHDTYWKQRQSYALLEHFTTEEVNALLEQGHKHEITLSTLISTYLLKNCRTGKKRAQTGFAVDTRSAGDESMSNQVAGISVDMRYQEKKDIWENAAVFQKIMKTRLNDPAYHYYVYQVIPSILPSLFDSVLFSRYGLHNSKLCDSFCRISGYSTETERTLGITNLNYLPIDEQYGNYTIQSCVFLPPAVSYSKKIIGIVTDKTGMHITYHGICENGIAPGIEFFTDTMKELHDLAHR